MISGLPNTLCIMLTQLASNNYLKSWNIFEDRYGHICCNVRFHVGGVLVTREAEIETPVLF